MTPARAVWFERAGVANLRSHELGPPGLGEVRVRVERSGVSAGTERLVLRGEVPEEARAIMAMPTMGGAFSFPVSYGYACAGVVEALGPGVSEDWAGEHVFALHPHHDRFVAGLGALRRVPRDVPFSRVTLAANLETAVNVVWDAAIGFGDDVIVAGLGAVGILTAWLASRSGAKVVGVDPEPLRCSLADALGFRAEASIEAADVASADALVDCSGSPAALATLVERAGPSARLVAASWYGAKPVALSLGGSFHPHRVTLSSSQVAHLPPHRLPRWDYDRRFRLVCRELANPLLDALIAPPIALSDAPGLYEELARGESWPLPHRVFDATR